MDDIHKFYGQQTDVKWGYNRSLMGRSFSHPLIYNNNNKQFDPLNRSICVYGLVHIYDVPTFGPHLLCEHTMLSNKWKYCITYSYAEDAISLIVCTLLYVIWPGDQYLYFSNITYRELHQVLNLHIEFQKQLTCIYEYISFEHKYNIWCSLLHLYTLYTVYDYLHIKQKCLIFTTFALY